jgi:antitoxin component YwqK of YwqJK toxin-antitoxin module
LDELNGVWKTYDETGVLIESNFYEKGKIIKTIRY